MKYIATAYVFLKKALKRILMLVTRSKFRSYGRNFIFDPYGEYSFGTISVGDDVYIGPGANFSAPNTYIKIGNKVMFGPQSLLIAGDHNASVIGKYMADVKVKRANDDLPIVIEDDVWVGARVTILKGVTIGRGSIIAAGAVVSRDVPPYSIAGGIPAKVLKPRWSEEQIVQHEHLLNTSVY